MSVSVYVWFLLVGKSYTFAASLAWISPAVERHILLVSNLETEAEIAPTSCLNLSSPLALYTTTLLHSCGMT